MSPSETFCVLPWLHVNLWPSGDVHHCCLAEKDNAMGQLSTATPDQIVNNKKYKDLRLKMLKGEKPFSCMRCFEREDHNIVSMRQHHNDFFQDRIDSVLSKTQPDGHVDDFKFEYWDFRFSNLCNMKCRMCGSHFSSQWYDEEVELVRRGNLNSKSYPVASHRLMNAQDTSSFDIIEWIDSKIDDVKYIYFAGGEPLIMDEHYYILQKLIEKDRRDVKIKYNTNLLKLRFKQHDLLDMWSNFNDIQVSASIDDIDARAEYIRKGTVWKDIENNLQQLNTTNVKLHIECTTQILNVLNLPKLFERLQTIGIPSYSIMLHNVLQSPEHYTVKVLSDELKQQVKNQFEDCLNTLEHKERAILEPKLKNILDYMYDMNNFDRQEQQRRFKKRTQQMDNLRQENFNKVFPELEEWYNGISL